MEKRKPTEETVSASLKKLDLSSTASNPNSSRSISTLQSSRFRREKGRPPSLVSLCVGVLGRHLEDVIGELREISVGFPAHIKLAIVAIARRRKLLNDDLILSLVDSSWEILDISGSDVTDTCLAEVSKICSRIRAVDISRCFQITPAGVSELVQHCKLLNTLRWGGCPRSNYTARRSLGILKPELIDLEGDSWEELDAAEIAHGAESLRWLLWPMIDNDSQETLATECPRIIVNPKPSPLGFRGFDVPIEAHSDTALDDSIVKDISPTTWAVGGFAPRSISPCISGTPGIELSMAERFRLAFLDRDTRLAPKRAKNARQRQRRAEREMLMSSTNAKAIALASRATKSFHG
ncbi:unnamed protein product [Linum tenue]|uniref:RNI-like superfamily protein n=1 Tax=Linum tenue TaxID=586396 RepID=A0AAV0LSC1_9ROSI|nr:unnamed protein product [Linum tenue]